MITIADVEKVASLARLALTDEEKRQLTGELSSIMQHFTELQSIDTSGVEPLAHALTITNVMREDEVKTPPGSEILLQSAPAAENGFFRVPKIGNDLA